MPLEENDWFPAARLEARIDALACGADLVEQFLVALDLCAARRADLHEQKAPVICPIQFQKMFDPAEALENYVGGIDATHADTHPGSFHAELFAQGSAFLAGISLGFVRACVFRKRHADRIGPHSRDVALTIDGEAVPLSERFHGAVHRLEEIVAVRLYLKSDEIRAEQAVNQLALPRTDAENLGVRPGNVPENRNSRVRARFFDHSRQQREVIILREKDWRFCSIHFFKHGIGKTPLPANLIHPVLWPERRSPIPTLTHPPNPLVPKSPLTS